MPIDKKEFKGNVGYAFLAQSLALLLSIIMSLIVPKFLGIESFSYWQLFIFYTSYGGFLHFGLNDGIYLKIGGKRYDSLDYSQFGTQFKYSIIWQSIISIVVIVISTIYFEEDRLFVIWLSCICTLINNSISYFGYILQGVNNIKAYSISLISEKIIFIAIIIGFFILHQNDYKWLIIFYVISRIIAMIYCFYVTREILISHFLNYANIYPELITNIKHGLILTFSNVASMLILGIGRFLIDANFGIIVFGKVSFAIIMTNFFLVFMNQISLVLFPALRRIEVEELSGYYQKINRLVTVITPSFLLSYLFIQILIHYWLPEYKDSLIYLLYLLPLVIYDGKMQLLYNTFLKVLREEKRLLFFNIISCIISILLSLISVYILHDIDCVIISMLIALIIRSTLAELFLAKKYKLNAKSDMLLMNSLILLFIISFNYLSVWQATILYSIFYILYLLKYRRFLSPIWSNIKNKT